MRPRRLKLGTHVDSGQMDHVYWNQAAVLICPSISSFFFLSYFQTLKIFVALFSESVSPIKLTLDGQWVDVSCVPQSGCCFLFVPYFFLSNVKKFLIFITGTVRPKMFKLGILVDSGWMYCVYQNWAAAVYLSLYFFIFLSLQLSNINNFRHSFLRNCEA